LIALTDIRFSYRREPGAPLALDGVCVSVEPGQEVAVLGANGSGKSTLARLVNGLLLPDEGTVRVDEIEVRDPGHAREVRERVGIVFQRPDDQIVATSVEDEVAFGPENLGVPREEIRERVAEAISAVGLTGLERREPHLLSGGQKQRLAIAGALAMRPRYLVLDEPTSMLDPTGRAEVLAIVEQQRAAGTGVLHITHDLADVLAADRAIVLDGGRVVFDGPVAGLLGEEGLLEACGLELPPIARLADALRAAGVPAPSAAGGAEALVEALWA
jgi:energy-coupling factor transport system ATP-binding protein